jgi:hypothetical protein
MGDDEMRSLQSLSSLRTCAITISVSRQKGTSHFDKTRRKRNDRDVEDFCVKESACDFEDGAAILNNALWHLHMDHRGESNADAIDLIRFQIMAEFRADEPPKGQESAAAEPI